MGKNRKMYILDKKMQLIIFFVMFIMIFKIISIYFLLSGHQCAETLGAYYDYFKIGNFIKHLEMKAIPSSWPDIDIHSYVYDFSVMYHMNSNLNIIEGKTNIMPDNIMPYGPLSFLLFYLISKVKITLALIVFRIISTGLFVGSIVTALVKKKIQGIYIFFMVIIFLFISTPFQIFILSGNIEIFLFSLCLLALSIKEKYPVISVSLIAFCTSIKYYPIIFMLDLIKDRKYKLFIYTVTLTAFLFFIPFGFLHGGFWENIKFTFNQILLSSKLASSNPAIFCHYGGLSMALFFYNIDLPFYLQDMLYKIFSILVLVSGLYSYIRIKDKVFALTGLITMICLIPQVSVFYKLSYFLIPILLSNKDKSLIKLAVVFITALCLSPVPFYLALNFSGMLADFSFLIFIIHLLVFLYSLKLNFHNENRNCLCRNLQL
jgi:hypothetical protein